MSRRQPALAAVALAAACVALPAHAEFNANIEFDNTYQDQGRGLSQGGRVEVNAIGRGLGADGAFIAGKASILAKRDSSVGMDDLWVQVGNKGGDVKLGRFEAADVFPLGRDTIVDRAGSGFAYRTNLLRGRFTGGTFHGAGTVNFGSGMSLELGLVESKGATYAGSVNNGNMGIQAKGVRPVLTYDANGLTVRVGAEVGKTGAAMDKFKGFGATVISDLGGGTKVNVNFASGKVDAADDRSTAVGLGAYLGAAHAAIEFAKNGDEKITTAYASYSMPLMGIKGASITPALSTSKASNGVGPDKANSLRVRLNYAF